MNDSIVDTNRIYLCFFPILLEGSMPRGLILTQKGPRRARQVMLGDSRGRRPRNSEGFMKLAKLAGLAAVAALASFALYVPTTEAG